MIFWWQIIPLFAVALRNLSLDYKLGPSTSGFKLTIIGRILAIKGVGHLESKDAHE